MKVSKDWVLKNAGLIQNVSLTLVVAIIGLLCALPFIV